MPGGAFGADLLADGTEDIFSGLGRPAEDNFYCGASGQLVLFMAGGGF